MKKTIALVTGGFSAEAVISYRSARTIDTHLDRSRYDVYLIDINREGWWYTDAAGNRTAVDRNDFTLPLPAGRIRFDAVFIGMHGTPGEDGKLQGYFDMLGLPYTGCDAATSAITFNKRYAVAVAGMAGIAVARSVLFHQGAAADLSLVSGMKFPVFVKPNNGGSSIGMSKVNQPGPELEAALEKAFREDSQVLVEEMIRGREFTVGVFRRNGEVQVLPLTEVKAHADKDFFDFEAKYQGKSDEVTPAVVDEAVAEKIRAAARQVYEAFNCRGVIRIDFIYNEEEQRPYMLEVNTIPGQSEASVVPQQVRANGWNLDTFYTWIMEEALPPTSH